MSVPVNSQQAISDVLVVGGGPIGVCCAFALASTGAAVTLIERQPSMCPPESAAFANCGLITPSEVVPLAAPGVVKRGLRWMLSSTSPFHVTPRPSPSLARWLWLFRASCAVAACGARIPVLGGLQNLAGSLHHELGLEYGDRWGYRHAGLLEVCETAEGLEELDQDVEVARRMGVRAERLTAESVRQRFPGLRGAVAGGYLFPEDGHVDPDRFVREVGSLAAASGACLLTGVEALSISAERSHVRVLTTVGELVAQQVVIAAGVWTRPLVRSLGLRLPLEAAKGYSIDVDGQGDFGDTPVLLLEESTVLTPLSKSLRIGSTLELSGHDMSVPPRRVAHLRRVGARAAGLEAAAPLRQVWRGLRPLSPDGLPFVGRCPGHHNVIVATGHCMLGLTLAPATGRIVAGLAGGEPPAFDLNALLPARFA